MTKRALVFCEDAWHSGALVREGLNALTDPPLSFEFIARSDQFSPTLFKDFPVVVVAKANHLSATDQRPWLTAETQSAFRSFVQAGGGLFLIHGGVCYRDLAEMREVTGGAFLSHPEACPVRIHPKVGHPLVVNVETFSVQDEHYVMALDAKEVEVFLRSRSEHGTQPAGWIRTQGEGRVCALTPGHNREVWLHREYQTLIRNGLVWLAKMN